MDRRYVKRMDAYWDMQYRSAIASIDHLDVDSWFDLWHTHVDWKRKGNRFAWQRRRAATLVFDAFLHLLRVVAGRREPIQVWALFCEDTGDHSVYLHTRNPNGTPFPYVFESTTWGIDLPAELDHLPLKSHMEVGRMSFDGETMYVIRERV